MNFFFSRNKIFHNLCTLWIKVNKGWTKNWINIMNYSETYEKDISSKLAIMTTVFSFISICAYCRKDWSVYIRYNYNDCKQSCFPVKWLFTLSLVVKYTLSIVKQYAWISNMRMCDLPLKNFDFFTVHAVVFGAILSLPRY